MEGSFINNNRVMEEGDRNSPAVEEHHKEDHKPTSYQRRHTTTTTTTTSTAGNSDDESLSKDSGNDHRKRKHHRSNERNKDDHSKKHKSRSDERRKKKHRKEKKHRRDRNSSESDDDDDDDSSNYNKNKKNKEASKKIMNTKLLDKLSARGETLEEREARRALRRAARITQKFGYTAENNPFNDPNLHEAFSWKKKNETLEKPDSSRQGKQDDIFDEIEKVRQRRQDREHHFEEMERIRAEESRMKELENYDDWARKEEEFHLQQQRQRSAIRLVEGREKPVDVLAKNLLMFGLSEEEKKNRAAVKYEEKYNALKELDTLEAELEEPHVVLKDLTLEELIELLSDVDEFRKLEREASSTFDTRNSAVLKYWDDIYLVTQDEINFLKYGGADGTRAMTILDIKKLFEGQLPDHLYKMKADVEDKIRASTVSAVDLEYWKTVLEQLIVYIAKIELSEVHSKMLVRQLERLEIKKDELQKAMEKEGKVAGRKEQGDDKDTADARPKDVDAGFGDLDEELGLADEIGLMNNGEDFVNNKFRHRKPRYFNRVKTGYDWNKYNQTHYDHDNPPPKTVHGYKFNIFYPDLIDKTKTPQYTLHRSDSDEFCIIRFHAGPPYEDIAFKIINREWNKSRKRGFRCTFERGVLSLYFNFKSHWYRR